MELVGPWSSRTSMIKPTSLDRVELAASCSKPWEMAVADVYIAA
jgi:hypothetical protein